MEVIRRKGLVGNESPSIHKLPKLDTRASERVEEGDDPGLMVVCQ